VYLLFGEGCSIGDDGVSRRKDGLRALLVGFVLQVRYELGVKE